MIIAAPTPTPTTTITTETTKQAVAAPAVHRRVVRKSTAPKARTVEKTTTSVTTSHQ